MIRHFPTALEPEYAQWRTLLWREEPQSGVRHVIRLQGELVQGGKELSHGAHSFVSDVDTVGEGQWDYPGGETSPQTSFRELVAARQLELEESLEQNRQNIKNLKGKVIFEQ